MRILLLGDAANPHIVRWASSLQRRGHVVALFSLTTPAGGLDLSDIAYVDLAKTADFKAGDWRKVRYLTAVNKLRSFAERFAPDVVSAHFASSYGLLALLARLRPRVTSVWGSDVYEFPDTVSYTHLTLPTICSV